MHPGRYNGFPTAVRHALLLPVMHSEGALCTLVRGNLRLGSDRKSSTIHNIICYGRPICRTFPPKTPIGEQGNEKTINIDQTRIIVLKQ